MATPAKVIPDVDQQLWLDGCAERIYALAKKTAEDIVEIGQILTAVKAAVGHGGFLAWLDEEFGWSKRTAQNFMNVYGCFKSATVAHLDIDFRALYLLAAPSTPALVREQALEQATNGHRVTMPELRRMIDKERAAMYPEAPAARKPPHSAPASKADEEALRQRFAEGNAWAEAFMGTMDAIEVLSRPDLVIDELVRDMRRLDSPDKDWTGRAVTARKVLEELERKLCG
jgi:hypothetical protein